MLSLALTKTAVPQGINQLTIPEGRPFRGSEDAGFQKVNVLYLLVYTPLELTNEQHDAIEGLLQFQQEMELAVQKERKRFEDQFPPPRTENDTKKIVEKWRQIADDRLQSRLDLERRIAELLTEEQLGRLRTAAKAAALTRFNNFNELVAAAMKQNDVKFEFEAGTFERQQEILARYRERLRRLQAETVDELLKTLPPEARKATEELMALDVLQRKD